MRSFELQQRVSRTCSDELILQSFCFEKKKRNIKKTIMNKSPDRTTCIFNIGLYRSGTTTLCKAAQRLGLQVHREFPDLDQSLFKAFLLTPQKIVSEWFFNGGRAVLLELASKHDVLCDGWIVLLPFLERDEINRLYPRRASIWKMHKICGVHSRCKFNNKIRAATLGLS